MGCVYVHGADEWCWHVPFALWVCGNGLSSLGHDLHSMMHPFQAQETLSKWAGFGQILQKYRQNINDAVWCMTLFVELINGSGTLNFPCGCVTLDWQAWDVTYMAGCIPFRPHSTQQIGWF